MNQTTEEKLAKLLQEFAELKAKLAGTLSREGRIEGAGRAPRTTEAFCFEPHP